MSTNENVYTAEEFYKQVGMLMEGDLDLLASLGFGKDAANSNGMFDTEKLSDLTQFCEKHPDYHIVTVVDTDGDTAYLNTVAFVNRLGYYLANGDKDESLFADIDMIEMECLEGDEEEEEGQK